MRARRCSRCGRSLPGHKPRLYSHWTRSYYCTDIDACGRRAKRRRREAVHA